MTPEDIKIVRSSWRKLMGIDPAILGDVFLHQVVYRTTGPSKTFSG
jgi:hypothetical protein